MTFRGYIGVLFSFRGLGVQGLGGRKGKGFNTYVEKMLIAFVV